MNTDNRLSEPSPKTLPPGSGYAVFIAVVKNEGQNVIFELAGTAFLYWLAGVWRLGAVVGFFVYALIVVLEAFHVIQTRMLGHRTEALDKIESPQPNPGTIWARRALNVRWASLIISLLLLEVVARRLWAD